MDNAVYSLKQVGQHQGHYFCIKRTVLRPLFEPFEPRQRAIQAKRFWISTSEYPNFWLHGIVQERRTFGHLFFWTDYILCWSILFISFLIISCLNFLKKNYNTNKNKIHLQYNI